MPFCSLWSSEHTSPAFKFIFPRQSFQIFHFTTSQFLQTVFRNLTKYFPSNYLAKFQSEIYQAKKQACIVKNSTQTHSFLFIFPEFLIKPISGFTHTLWGWNILTLWSAHTTRSPVIFQLWLSSMVCLSFKCFKSPFMNFKGNWSQSPPPVITGTPCSSFLASLFFPLQFLPPPSYALTPKCLSKVPSEFCSPFVQHDLSEIKCEQMEFSLGKKRRDWTVEKEKREASATLNI